MNPHSGPGFRGHNRSTRDGGPNGVQSTYASQLREHEALFTTYEHLQGLPRGDSALSLLRKIASMVKPIMRKRGWRVGTLAEFLPPEQNLLGLNINRGWKICLRLRYHNNTDLFLPIEQVVDTMLHELSHNVWGEHDGNFHKLWDELRDEHETLLMRGFTGEGFLGRGQVLGGRNSVPAPQDMRRLALESAQQRQNRAGLATGSGNRLGGQPLHHGQDVREVIAGQALLRTTVNRGCASVRNDARAIANQADRLTFKTQAEEDDANNRAIAEALYDLIQAEETAKVNGTYGKPNPQGGLAWTPEQGLFDPSEQTSLHGTSATALPTEEEQMKWAIEESNRLEAGNSADYGGLPPESLVSPISPMTPSTQGNRSRAPSLAASLRQYNSAPSPMKPQQTRSNRSESVVSTNPLTPIVDLSEPFNPDEWACEICTCVNPLQFLACDACGTERSIKASRQAGIDTEMPVSSLQPKRKPVPSNSTAPRQQPVMSSNSMQPTQSRQQSIGWNCSRCGSFMEHKWWTCTACGLMKASS